MNSAIVASPIVQRLYFLDWLRIAAFALLVLYHVGMVYVRWDFHVKSPFAGPALEPWMKLTEPWRMSLLFIVSGAATAHLCKNSVSWRLVRARSRHLLLPLLCGMVLVVPPQPYVEVMQKLGYSGSYLDFLGLYFSGYPGLCPNGHCLVLPTWNHLWFLPYLWLYSALLFALLAMWPQALVGLARLAHRALAGFLLLALPVVLIFGARLLLFKRFPSTHAVVGDYFNHTIYFAMFITGAVFASAPPMWDRLARLRWPHWPAWFEAPVLVLLTFVFCAVGYLLLRGSMLLRPWFGMVKARPVHTTPIPKPRP